MDAIDKMDIYHYLELQTLNPKEKTNEYDVQQKSIEEVFYQGLV